MFTNVYSGFCILSQNRMPEFLSLVAAYPLLLPSLARLPSSLPSVFPPVCRWRHGGLVSVSWRCGVNGSGPESFGKFSVASVVRRMPFLIARRGSKL